MNQRIGILIVTVLFGGAAWLWWPADEYIAPSASAVSQTRHPVAPALALPANWPPPMPRGATDELARVPLTPLDPAIPAAQSLADAREHGDPRTPPMQRDPEGDANPAPAELADPAAYQQYETRQNRRLFSQYVQAADANVPQLRDDIARARIVGVTPEQIAKVEEKVRRIELMRNKLVSEQPTLGR